MNDQQNADRDEFSVVLCFPDDSEFVEREWIGAEEAVKLAHSCILRPAATIGMIRRVIITDGEDYCVFEWKFGEGVTFPPRERKQ